MGSLHHPLHKALFVGGVRLGMARLSSHDHSKVTWLSGTSPNFQLGDTSTHGWFSHCHVSFPQIYHTFASSLISSK